MLRTQEKKLDLHDQGDSVNPRQIKARIQVHKNIESHVRKEQATNQIMEQHKARQIGVHL